MNWVIFLEDAYIFFFSFGLILLLLELFGAEGYALWTGISALIVGVIAFFFPISLFWLWIIFAVLSFIVAFFWWKWSKKYKKKYSNKEDQLNLGAKKLIGIKSTLIEPIDDDLLGRIKIGDGSWIATSETPIEKGKQVKVIGVNGTVLIVEKC